MSERLTVGIPAYREEQAIGRTLETILSQELPPNVSLDIVVCAREGTDKTEEIVMGLTDTHPEIRLLRTDLPGKPIAWNSIVKAANDSDIFVFCDADIELKNDTLQHLYKSLKKDSQLKLVGAHLVMITDGSQGIMRVINPILANTPPKGTLNGRLYGITNDAIQTVGVMPPWIINEDEYLALHTLDKYGKQSYQINLNAKANYAGPLTLKDWVGYRSRTAAGHRQLKRLYPHLDFKPYGTLYGRRDYIRNLPLQQKMVLPLMAVMAFYADTLGSEWWELGYIRGINRIESTKRPINSPIVST